MYMCVIQVSKQALLQCTDRNTLYTTPMVGQFVYAQCTVCMHRLVINLHVYTLYISKIFQECLTIKTIYFNYSL